MSEKNWFVYLLECNDGSFYTGITNDIEKRMNAHAKCNGSKYVAIKGFKQLIAYKVCDSKSHACKCEYEVKKLSRHKKICWFK